MSASIEKLPKKQPSRRTAIVAMFLGLVVAVFTVVAEQPEASAPSVSAEDVAREILEIQNQLGGSIVTDSSQQLLNLPAASPQRLSDTAQTRINHLRETAWQLDSAAHRLERLDLYSQADALRDLASQLRLDARGMKGARNMKREAEKKE